jgi:hypothetical protein
MKKTLLSFLFLCCIISCKTVYDSTRKIDKAYQYAPPGTVWIKDSIYIDQCEIKNLDYLEYLNWLQKMIP